MWMRVDRAGGSTYSFFDSMTDRPIHGTEWTYYSIDAPVRGGLGSHLHWHLPDHTRLGVL